jgi:hypothetical protein
VVGDDVLDGGEGFDVLGMWRKRDVAVDLAAGTASGPDERDVVGGFERIVTGDGDDRVLGSEGADGISTGPGDDEVDGRGGNDQIDGGSGANELHGGAGDDRLRFSARSCGDGADVLEGSFIPAAPADCESIGVEGWVNSLGTLVTREPVQFGRHGVSFRVSCPATSLASDCELRLSVRTRRGTVIARAPRLLRVPSGGTALARLRMTRDGRRILRARRVQVRVLDGEHDDGWRATYATRR